MATHPATQLTMVELAHRMDPKGNLATIAEVLVEDNEMIKDAVWQEANATFSHKIVRRSALPAGSWRKISEGVGIEASKTREVTEGIAMLESYSETDIELVNAAPNPAAFRMGEARSFIEGMSQTLADTLITGNATTTPETFTGFAPRMASLAAATNVIGSGGTGSDLTSIYICQWGIGKVFMIYPKGSTVGLKHTDMGEQTVTSIASASALDNTGQFQAYRDHFQVKAGLAVQDPRCIARLANIESTGTSNIFDEDNLIKLLNRMPMSGSGAVLYVNDTVKSQMEIALKDKTNVYYTADAGEGLAGVPIIRFRGNKIAKMDAVTITETALT